MACGANVHAGWWGLAGTTTYQVGGGAKGVERNEQIIYSWDREGEPVGLF